MTPGVALAAGARKWWVQTWNSAGLGPWSIPLSFVVSSVPGPATLISPTGTINTMTPTYVWSAVASASWYLLWVQDLGRLPRIQVWYTASQAASGTGTCSVAPAISLTPGAATWWIQTYSTKGYGPWSAGLSFSVFGVTPPGKAILLSPSGEASSASPTYPWNAVNSATWYLLWVEDATSFTCRLSLWVTAAQAGCAAGTGACSYTPGIALLPGAAQWWIRTWNDAGPGSSVMAWASRSLRERALPSGSHSDQSPEYDVVLKINDLCHRCA